ncbi:hypothetical protein W97_04884 [Coniosporium apollinis CBS 100218]|uniref:Uncharacterized protein n=1 Tax=Coniosporium apollinis (strain CBS 100218) TaxID=1168221 RepID=R7YUR0_CONA1|nr:uncharacterized protein W97_04884 [Coniosporium apollinis CBS 100218]EON65645.1 hypothetical protein W97_04884 [Coniosporium apollinis CBS 100218]
MQPWASGVKIPYNASFTAAQYERIKRGHVPTEMEDKWYIYYGEPHLWFVRSWTGLRVFRKGGAGRERWKRQEIWREQRGRQGQSTQELGKGAEGEWGILGTVVPEGVVEDRGVATGMRTGVVVDRHTMIGAMIKASTEAMDMHMDMLIVLDEETMQQ